MSKNRVTDAVSQITAGLLKAVAEAHERRHQRERKCCTWHIRSILLPGQKKHLGVATIVWRCNCAKHVMATLRPAILLDSEQPICERRYRARR